jgi:hypothetical protein
VSRKLLLAEARLWNFAAVEGVPSHNNAKCALGHGVIWRKASYGTVSEAGRRLVERVLTLLATCPQASRDVVEFLTAYLRTWHISSLDPSRLA